MRIDEMVLREDFYSINENTLNRYFKTVYGEAADIKTSGYNFKSHLVIYPRVGIIMTRTPSIKILRFLLKQYNIRNKMIKRTLAKLYVLCCCFSAGLLSEKGLEVCPKSIIGDSAAIIPANRKIRIYYFDEGYVDAVIKNGFTRKYFDNELSYRLKNSYAFIPKILDYGEDWYREKILSGQSLARITDERLYQKCVREAAGYMKIIAVGSLEYIDASEYAKKLYDDIKAKIKAAKSIKNISSCETVLEIAEKAVMKCILLNAMIPAAESHGDLQSGNVWVENESERTYIIDWETHQKRSIWYDCATIFLSTRRADMLKKMMDDREKDYVRESILFNDTRKDYNMLAVIAVITLEDIMFYLEDMLELPLDYGGKIFDSMAEEIDKMGWRYHE